MSSTARFVFPVVFVSAFLLNACSKGEAEGKPAFEVIAKVNEQEIQANELSSALARSAAQGVPEGAALERLIDQELMVQRARERRLDRDPRVLQSFEAAQREILARAYLEQVTEQIAPPGDAEIAAFYAANPELFARRRIYSLQELEIRIPEERFGELERLSARAEGLHEVKEWLAREQIEFRHATAVKPAEQLPLESLKGFARMKDGQMVLSRTGAGALLVHLVTSREQPLDEAAARPMIERYLLNARKSALAKAEVERLRDGARIEYAPAAPAVQQAASPSQ
ncbi:EpsD family peptidyl-prolyl cis-trans isomerase [Aromatoleum petrolei]|uniref:Peptidyl-prolyl cis-trans isomerase, EpsD family n=1 Tax=Aromatoleum petrolei TaxID=76116 RepID=A0ABX1MIK0_9RHOO|nr:EpsD family peptidyl-prolyl cis-trans isomerase [Aromatoleum petrolei]NMF86991.1 peptidyl-prolyl cis-trans isomerase, EpsD family [Aromatoleum petrolei]QTQ37586.1 Peptidyl-prolyl cis-trans isomerase domain-containing protein [Aromatoleum petrolei]